MDNSASSTRMDRTLVKAIADYLARHPQAADSLEGIRQWWLPASLRTVPMQQLKLALEEMIAAGDVKRNSLPDGSDLYACATPAPRQPPQ